MCNDSNPPLTTVHVPKYAMGRIAAERLIHRIRQTDDSAVSIEVSTNLVLRESI